MRVRIALIKGLADVCTPWEIINALGLDPKDILKRFDVCKVLPHGPRELCDLAGDVVNFVIDKVGGEKAVVNAVTEVFGTEKVIEVILSLVGVPQEITLKEKPALKPRAREIGDVLRNDGYDLVALCETWNADLRDELLDHWRLPSDVKHMAFGQFEGEVFLGDGLLLGSTDGRILDVQGKTYNTRGINRTPGRVLDMLADDELWAQKGVLLVRIDVGVGVLDVYITHLYYGTGLADIVIAGIDLRSPNNVEREHVRSAQLNELSHFITSTHNTDNVAIVCGDFNIDGNGENPNYAGSHALQQFANHHNLQDMWVSPHGGLKGFTSGDFSNICASPEPSDHRFCLDTTDSNSGGGSRIDFMFVEHPQPHHSFMLDVTRVRRRSFPRSQVTEDQAHMSDHLGLDCTLLASRK